VVCDRHIPVYFPYDAGGADILRIVSDSLSRGEEVSEKILSSPPAFSPAREQSNWTAPPIIPAGEGELSAMRDESRAAREEEPARLLRTCRIENILSADVRF
jgi:hypothetical protein